MDQTRNLLKLTTALGGLFYRIRELAKSEKSLLQEISASQLPSMQHSQRLDQRLHKLRDEVRTMTQDKELTERLWRGRLQRCQRQLKAKEEEMSRQSQYFENFKIQLQHKLSLAQDREQSLQNRIYTLEKQLLDVTVSAATGMATIREVRITAGTVTHLNEQDRLPSMREQGEGEEEKKEERRKLCQSDMIEERSKVNEGKLESDVDGGGNRDMKQTSNEARLQSFIISLQEDLKVLLEREEDGLTERRKLQEQLQEAQENSHFLGGKVEEMKAEMHQLRMTESSLMEEVEELKQEHERLAANPALPQSSTEPDSTSPGSSCSPAVPLNTPLNVTVMGQSSPRRFREVQPIAEEKQVKNQLFAVPPVDHRGAAEHTKNNSEDRFSSSKSKIQTNHEGIKLFPPFGSKSNSSFQSLPFTAESLNEFKVGNMEECPSEESDALREAFQSLGLGEDLQALREQRENLEVALQKTQAQLEAVAQENVQLKLQLRMDAEEQLRVTEPWSSRKKIITSSSFDRDDHLQLFPAKDDAVPAQEDLIQALNQENRALAEKIQELLTHIKLREEEMKKERRELEEQISRLEEDAVRTEQENQEQASLISELNKKTEDDLNTIMELQQKLVEVKGESEQQGSTQRQRDQQAGVSGGLPTGVLKGDEDINMSHENSSTTAPSSGCHGNIQLDLIQNISPNYLCVNSPTDPTVQLTNSIQSLKSEQGELTASVSALREQQREVTLSVQTQTEEKQQLTRTVWALKEQKDAIVQSLSGLKQEKEQLSRTIFRLKNERDQLLKSVSGLKEEKEQLTESLSVLQSDKEIIIKSLSSLKEETNEVTQSLQSLRTESDQLSQTVLYLKEQRDEVTRSLKCLTEKRDTHTLKEDHDQLRQSVSSLKEEKEKLKQSISCLKQEENQIKQIILDLREEKQNIQTLTEISHKQQQLDPCSAAGIRDPAVPGCETSNHRDKFLQKQNELMKQAEALGAELKKLQEEVDARYEETRMLQMELSQCKAQREEAEAKAAQAAEHVIRLTETINQQEEIRKENQSQVKELQNKLSVLLKEKTDASSLKTQREEQINILSSHLKAKSVALEELNMEYLALKQGRGSRDDLSAALASLRARYNDIRAKYDALLKRKSQTDLDVAPLKAKLSCLVMKCQERNCLLVEMMKSMQKQDRVDPRLTEQVKCLLNDAALQEYAAAFTPGSCTQTPCVGSWFTQEFFTKFQDHNKRVTLDETRSVSSTYVSQQQNKVLHESEGEKLTSVFAGETLENLQDCREVSAGETEKKHSPGPASPAQEPNGVQVSPVIQLKDGIRTDPSQPSPTNQREKLGFQRLDVKQQSSSDLISLDKQSPAFRVSPSRRLNSPEKIINLHEQLQKTLMSSFQAPEIRGRGPEPRRTPSLSAQTHLNSTTTQHNPPFSFQHTPVVTTKPASSKSVTLVNAVASRSANAALTPSVFTHPHLKVDVVNTNTSSSNFPNATVASRKDQSISSVNITGATNTTHTASTPLITFNPDALNFKNTPSDTTSSKFNIYNINCGAPTADCLTFTTSQKSAVESTAALGKPSRPKPEAPAEVCSVEVIKTVGQNSLLIGWERPPLDELGCSNGTFVYGYRVFVNREFHKSVMSSACTKCILENVDQRDPVHISVQTLGSNGLRSNAVQIIYTSNKT